MSTSLRRVAATAVVSGLASLAFAGPAQALMAHDPEVGSIVRADNNTGLTTPSRTPTPVAAEEDTPWMELGIGALGGLALAGVGIAAASRVRHRQSVTT
jgi:hypothetical protein